jgi:cyclopropane fatty-acyl-phospholipid synthase-like methyltransferase
MFASGEEKRCWKMAICMETLLRGEKYTWQDYFSDKMDSYKLSTWEFFRKEAKEKLFHLNGGRSLLDFGCGAGELLIHYAPNYEKVVGADFSSSMLFEAERKVWQEHCKNVSLILADDITIWDKLNLSFDRIAATSVIQYMTPEQIDSFVENASGYLNDDGKIAFFDIIDPRLYFLWKTGWFSGNFKFWKSLSKINLQAFIQTSTSKKYSTGAVESSYNPHLIEKITNKHGFKMEYIRSMYSEYRYHAILSRVS